MKIYNKLLVLSAAVLMTAGVTSCGGGGGGSNYKNFEGDPTQLSANITFWHTMGQSNMATLDSMITAFNKIYPNIKIEHAAQGGYGDIKSKISAAIPAGTTPTMAYCYPDHVAYYLNSGAVEDMTGYTKDPIIGLGEEGTTDFVDAYWQEGVNYASEGIYSTPFSKSTEVMFYNQDFFEENNLTVPTTWDEMETVCKKIKEIDPASTPFGYDSDDNLFITMCQQLGIPYTSMDPENHYLFDNDEAKALVKKIKGWYDDGLFVTQGTSPNSAYTSTMFTEGKLYMTVGSTGGTGYNYTENFKTGVATVPGWGTKGVEGQADDIIMQGPSICFFSRASQTERYAAWLFYKFITDTDNSAIYSILTGYAPVRKSSFECDIFQEYIHDEKAVGKNDLIKRTVGKNTELLDRFFTSPAFKGSSTAREEVGGIITNVLLGTKTINAAFDDAMTNCIFAS